MKAGAIISAGLVAAVAASASGETVLFCPFDSLAGWAVRSVGTGSAALVPRPDQTHHARLAATRGTVLLSRLLPLDAVRGRRVTVRCLVRAEGIARGPQAVSVPKVHLAVRTPRGIRHHAARLDANCDWHAEGFTAEVPADADRVVINLGMESCTGTMELSRLIVLNDRKAAVPLDLSPAANAAHEQLGLGAFPKGTIEWQGVPFHILDADRHEGRDCLRLKGTGHADWPASTSAPVRVGRGASSIYILHGVLGGGGKSPSPCALWTARFVGGQTAGLSVFEGRQVGAIGQTRDLPEWKVAWRGRDEAGREITFGVTQWTLYSDAPLLELSCAAYQGSPPVVLAVTVVEEPPAPPPEADDEGAGDSEVLE